MKYSLDIYRLDSREVQFYADSPEDAVKLARAAHPGFHVESLHEVLEDGSTGQEFQPVAHCEACDVVLWSGDAMYPSGPDAVICSKCVKKQEAA